MTPTTIDVLRAEIRAWQRLQSSAGATLRDYTRMAELMFSVREAALDAQRDTNALPPSPASDPAEVGEPPSTFACECLTWASEGVRSAIDLLDHHQHCPRRGETDVVAQFAQRVANAMRWWGQQEDGIPDALADVYRTARMLARCVQPPAGERKGEQHGG